MTGIEFSIAMVILIALAILIMVWPPRYRDQDR